MATSGQTTPPQTLPLRLGALPSHQPTLKRVQAGIARTRLGRGQPSKIRLPITAKILRQIKHKLAQVAHPEKLVLWAVCCTAFFVFFRLGELLLLSPAAFNPRLHMAWGDMAVDNPHATTMIRFCLKQSQTDQFGRGVDVIVGRTGLDLCPVAAVLAYVAKRGDQPGPFFLTTAKTPLTKQAFVGVVRELLRALELPEEKIRGAQFSNWRSDICRTRRG